MPVAQADCPASHFTTPAQSSDRLISSSGRPANDRAVNRNAVSSEGSQRARRGEENPAVPFLYAALLVYLAAIGTLGIVLVLLIRVQQITDRWTERRRQRRVREPGRHDDPR